MSLRRSLQRVGFPFSLSNLLVRGDYGRFSFFVKGNIFSEKPYGSGRRKGQENVLDWYENSTLSRPHMEYLLEVINYIKYNRAKYQMYKQIGRNRSYSYTYTLRDAENDSDFLQELNAIARKMAHADDPLPLIDYTGDLFLIDTRRQPLETRYSDAEFRMMTENIRQHLADEPGYLLESRQINQREADILDEQLQRHPFWTFGELYPITSLNYPKAFK